MADHGPASGSGAGCSHHAELPAGPITSSTVTLAAKRCGSEVRRLLRDECVLIAECNICRELFRSLKAFVKHKQTHCQGCTEGYFEQPTEHKSNWKGGSALSGATAFMDESSNSGSESRLQDVTSEQRLCVNVDSELSGDVSESNDGTQRCLTGSLHGPPRRHQPEELASSGQPAEPRSWFRRDGSTTTSSVQPHYVQWAADCDDYDDDTGGEEVDSERQEPKDGSQSRAARGSGRMDSTVAASALKRSQHWSGKYDQTDCLVCNIKFISLDYLREHMVTHHPKNDTFYECPDCKKPFSQHWGAKRHLSNFHHKSKEEMDRLRGRLKKPARRSAAAVSGGCMSLAHRADWPLADSAGSDDVADAATTAEHMPMLSAGPADAVMMKKKRLDLHVCSLCSKVFGSSQLMLKHEEHCLGRTSPVPAATAPGSADLATSGSGGSETAITCVVGLAGATHLTDLTENGWLGDSSLEAAPTAGCSAAAADALLMLSQASLPTSSTPAARRSRRQPKPNRLFLNESDDDGGSSQPSRQSCGDAQSDPCHGEYMDLDLGSPAAVEPDRASAEGPRKRSAITKSRNVMDSSELDGIVDLRTLSCLVCNKQLSTNFNLRRHARRHLMLRQFKCRLCAYKSFDKCDCSAHVRRCHLPSDCDPISTVDDFIIDLGSQAVSDRPIAPRAVDGNDAAVRLVAGSAMPSVSMLSPAGSFPTNVGSDPHDPQL